MNILKKIPTRTCIGCGEQKPKNELIRIVKNQTGEIKVDKIGKLSGRGAYICDNSECLEKQYVLKTRKSFWNENRREYLRRFEKYYKSRSIDLVNNQKICGLLGLATRAGKIVAGTDACLQEIEKHNVKLLILAVDSADRTKSI